MVKLKGVLALVFLAGALSSCMTDPAFVGTVMPAAVFFKGKPQKPQKAVEAGSYNIMYANAFLQGAADMLPVSKFEKKERLYKKAIHYYLRGVDILRSAFERKYPGVNSSYEEGKIESYLKKFTKEDVPFLYWITAGTLGAYALDNLNFELNSKIPELSLFIKRAYELDPDFDKGTLDSFLMLFYGALPPGLGGDKVKARKFFTSAVEKTGGQNAGVYVSAAEVFAVPEQNLKLFNEYLDKAVMIDVNKSGDDMEILANKIARRKAAFMLANVDRYIFIPEDTE